MLTLHLLLVTDEAVASGLQVLGLLLLGHREHGLAFAAAVLELGNFDLALAGLVILCHYGATHSSFLASSEVKVV